MSKSKTLPKSVRRATPLALACLLALLLLGLYLLPGTPAGRSWLLSQLEPRLERSGISLSYGSSRGNLWHGLTLGAVTVTMPGAVLELDSLHISYALPSLLTGRLPLSVAISGLQGDLTLSELALPQGSGGGLWVRPVLRDLDIAEVALNINDIPYTLPNLSLSDFRAQDHGDTIAVDTTLATAAGRVALEAAVTLEPFTLTADIKKADVSVARHWWAGAEAGTLSGSLRVRDGEVSADLTLAGGAVNVAGLEVTHIHGEVHYQHPVIKTELVGTALGGPVTATGTVDIGARHWQGEVEGRPQLAEVAGWLAEGRLPAVLSDVDIEDFVDGSAETSLTLSGWRHVRLAGVATGEGRLLERPLEHLDVTYAYDSTRGTQVTAEASYAGAPLDVALEPRADGFHLKVSGSDVPLNDQLAADMALELTEGDEGLSGELDTSLTGTVAERALHLSLDGHLDSDGIQLFVSGRDEKGAYLTGAGVFQTGRLEAQLNVQGLSLPMLSAPVSVTASTGGELAALPLSIEVDAPAPLYLQVGKVQLINDLRGTLSAMLDVEGERRLTDISGHLGTLELAGTLNLSERTGNLSYSLAPSPLSGPLQGRLELQNGALTLRESALQSQVKLVMNGLSFGALRLSPLAANVSLNLADSLSLELQDSAKGLQLALAEGILTATFEETTLELSGQTITLDGSAQTDMAHLVDSLELDLRASAPLGHLTLTGDAEAAKLRLASEAGLKMGGLTLQEAINLQGSLSVKQQQVHLQGNLGGLELALSGRRLDEGAAPSLTGELRLSSGADTLSLQADAAGNWRTSGSLALAALGEVLGLELSGSLTTDLAQQGDTYAGTAMVAGRFRDIPVGLELVGEGETLRVEANSTLLETPLKLVGEVQPQLDTVLTAGNLGHVNLQETEEGLVANGQGTVPALTLAGLRLDAQPWTLSASSASQTAQVNVGDSALSMSWGETGWQVDGTLQQLARYRNAIIKLNAEVSASAAEPTGSVNGTLLLATPSREASLPLTGSLEGFTITGNLSANFLAEAFGVGDVLAGDISMDGTAQLVGGLAYELAADWQAEGAGLELSLQGDRDSITGNLSGTGLSAQLNGSRLQLEAESFNLDPFVARPALAVTADGSLTHDLAAQSWGGKLTLTSGESVLTLMGKGASLGVEGELARGAIEASLAGTLRPEVRLELSAQTSDESLQFTGQIASGNLSGELLLKERHFPGDITVGSQQLLLSGNLNDGLHLSVTGEALNATFAAGKWSGTLALPVQISGEKHLMSGDLSGALAAPEFQGQIAGNYVEGILGLSRESSTAELQVDLSLWLPTTFAGLTSARATINATANANLDWTLDLSSAAKLRELPLQLEASITGERLSYRGSGDLHFGSETIPLNLSGEGGDFSISTTLDGMDLASFSSALPFEVTGNASGQAVLSHAADGFSYRTDLSVEGNFAGQAGRFEVTDGSGESLRLVGTLAGVDFALTAAENGAPYGLTVSDSARGVSLQSHLSLGEVLSLTGSGTVRGEAFELSATYNPATQEASWQAQLGGASLVGKLEPSIKSSLETEVLYLSSSLTAPAGSLNARALSAELSGRWQADALYVDKLTAHSGEDNHLTLSGRALPKPELSGDLTLAALAAPLAFSLTPAEVGYHLSVKVQDLTLQATLAPGFTIQSVQTDGSYADEVGRTLSTSLSWRAERGFAGQAELGLRLTPEAKLNLTLLGDGGLNIKGKLVVREAVAATVDVSLSRRPWRDRSMSGTVTLDASADAFLPSWPGEPLTLGGALALGGTLTEPILNGPVRLAGAINAAGMVQTTAGEFGLELQGESLTLNAGLNAQGWLLDGRLHGLELASLLPQLDSPQLSAELNASQVWGETPTVSAENVRLQTLRSLLSGRLSYDDGWQGRLELSANLADFKLGGKELRGTLTGPISLSSGQGEAEPLAVLAQLEAENIGVQGSDWLLSGDVTLTGTLRDPQLSVSLTGGGSASGKLYLFAEPRAQHYQLSSDLRLGDFSSQVRLAVNAGEVSATGELSWQAYGLSFAEASTPGAVQLVGEGKLAGWQGLVNFAAQRLRLQAELSTLATQLQGALELNYHWAENAPTPLTGQFNDIAVGGISLGDINISSNDTGAAKLSGAQLNATVTLDKGVNWQLARLELPLSQSLTLTATGAGTLTEASLQTRLQGSLAGQMLDVPIGATYGGGRLQLSSASQLLGGDFSLHAAYSAANGWTGTARLAGASLGRASLTAQGILYGDSQPQLYTDLSVTAENYESSGTLTLSQQGIRLEQQLTVTGLQAPLNIAGLVYPQLELSLNSGEDDGLYIATSADGLPTATGRLSMEFGSATFTASADPNGTELLTLTVAGGLPGLALQTSLPRLQPSELLEVVREAGLTFKGVEATSGTLTVALTGPLSASLDGLRWQGEVGTLSLDGVLHQQDGLNAELSGHWRGGAAMSDSTMNPVMTESTPFRFLPWLSELQDLPFQASLQAGRGQVTSTSALGTVTLQVDLQAPSLVLNADLARGKGGLQAALTYDAETGIQGEVKLEQLPLLAPRGAIPALSISGIVRADNRGLTGDVHLASNGSSVNLQGSFGWHRLLPSSLHAYFPASSDVRQLELRVNSFNLASLPGVQRRLPYLDAPLTGVVRLQGNNLVGQLLSPELSVLDQTLATQLEFNGAPFGEDAAVAVRASLGESRAELSYDGRVLSGLIKLEQFPLEVLGEAIIGESGVSASVTAITRLELPLLHPAQGVIRFASERLILERDGIVTEGQLALQYLHGNLIIDQAEFSGAGSWHAEGQISPEQLELSLTADNADFSPLLGLVPRLAALDIGARGSLSVRASNARDPEVTLQSSGLDFSLGGSSYHLDGLEASLQGGTLSVAAQMRGVNPISGRLNLAGGGPLQLFPFGASGLSFSFVGHAQVPTMGQITDIQGEISATAAGWQLDSRGLLGQPFTLSGSLAPLDLRLGGQRLQVSAPRYFLAESSVDAALRLTFDEAFILSGAVTGHEARLELGPEQAADAQDVTKLETSSSQAAPNPLLQRIIFNDIRISVPQQIRIQENFGSAELGLDVTLSGSAARPQLDGEARALRGSFSFSGRDFKIDAAVATFEPTQGVYPDLHIEASTRYEKQQVLSGGAAGLEFVAPRGSSSFTVFLNLDGSFELIELPSAEFTRKLQLDPTLSSNARIQGSGESTTFAPRPLAEDELLALLTLGKLEPGSVMGNFAGSAALSAVDTALDLFILSELQNLLGDALGLDLFEFRTTSLGSLLSGGEDSFGVSLRIGGYLSEELFASYRISSKDSEQYALSNEFGLRYDLGPLELKLETGINFLTESLDPVTNIGLSLGYAITPLIDISAGSDISSAGNSNFNLGLNIRW